MYARIIRKVVEPAIIGLDLSPRGTGLAVLEGGRLVRAVAWTDLKGLQKKHPDRLCWFKMDGSSESARMHRINLAAAWVLRTVDKFEAEHVAVEGYAFGSNQRGHSDVVELGGMVKAGLWQRGIPLRVYDPSSVKLASTGNGDAKKPDMVKAACTRFAALSAELPALLQENENAAGNIADAALIAALLREELKVRAGRVPLDTLPERLRRVFLRVTKAAPEALTTRPFLERKGIDQPQPVFASGRVAR